MSSAEQPSEVPLFHQPEAILAHPRFPGARTVYVEAILGLYENDPFMSRLLIVGARSVVFFTILCLHFGRDESDCETWPTLGRLKQTVAPFGLASPRRVDDIVGHFVSKGYVASTPAPFDRRARVLAPTSRMLAHDLDWLAAYYRPLELLFPDPGYAPPLRHDPAFQQAARAVGKTMSGYAARLIAHNAPFLLFMTRDAGSMILIKLVELALRGDGSRARPVSFADFGERFGVSRTHVREMLRDAERANLVEMSDGGVRLLPPLLAGFDRFIADTLAGSDLMFKMAMERLAVTPSLR